ncbi:MAG: sugar phosphate isomerase/epimerase [Akkermansiaceae bacterium]|jgi:sugar phosphate isomerase/epimerase|nr:sugar phosphate isomerase/epimerase [Akkermansiaceae bacterium]
MRTAVTLCRVPEAAAGPFVFHDHLETGFAKAAGHGFDAVELFLTGPDQVGTAEILDLARHHHLGIAAVGTGAGMVRHGLSLTDPDPGRRAAASDFILGMIDFAAALGAPTILGSMQGRHSGGTDRARALDHLAEALKRFDAAAAGHGQRFIYEPLNRYETNLFNQLAPAAAFLEGNDLHHTRLLADLFHLAIEEKDIAAALRASARWIGHVHWADSNRHAIGFGHTDPAPIAAALRETSYAGYLSAEVLPLPDSDAAAATTLSSIRLHFP